MLYCCNAYFSADRTLALYNNTTYKNRTLQISQCPKCGALKTIVTQYRIEDGKYSERKPKTSKDVANFIKKYEKEVYYETPDLKPKYGTKTNMSWTYADASKSLWVKDFNNVRKFRLKPELKVYNNLQTENKNIVCSLR